MIGDIERIKRVGENSMKAKTLGGKKKPKRIVQPQRIGATHVPRNVSNYDGMVENLPTMEPPIVGATSQLERMQEDNRLQRLEMKVSSMGNDISTMSRDISTMSRDMAMLATLLAPGAKAGGREYREADPVGIQATVDPGTSSFPEPEGERQSSVRCGRHKSREKAEACVNGETELHGRGVAHCIRGERKTPCLDPEACLAPAGTQLPLLQ